MPIDDTASELLGPEPDRDFRRLASELAAYPGIDWMPLSELGAFRSEDFSDPLHIRGKAIRRVTRRIAEAIRSALENTAVEPGV